jgi:hypothetical protein
MARHALLFVAFLFAASAWLAFAAAIPASADSALRIPSCALFLDLGERWIGIDETAAAEVLGIPLYALTDDDIDRIAKSLQACASAAETPDAKAVLTAGAKQIPSLRAARNRVRHAFADYEAAKKRAQPKLEQIATRLDGIAPTPRNRSAVDDSEATMSAIFFELEQRRQRAQVKAPLSEDYPPYAVALAALARKHEAYAEQARQELLGLAQDALQRHHDDVSRLGLPAEALDAAIVLQAIDAGRTVRWLTLRQWAALVLDNPENTTVNIGHGNGTTTGFTVEVVRPGYDTAEFAFRQDGQDLLLAESGVDGHLAGIDTPPKQREANDLLLAVVHWR